MEPATQGDIVAVQRQIDSLSKHVDELKADLRDTLTRHSDEDKQEFRAVRTEVRSSVEMLSTAIDASRAEAAKTATQVQEWAGGLSAVKFFAGLAGASCLSGAAAVIIFVIKHM